MEQTRDRTGILSSIPDSEEMEAQKIAASPESTPQPKGTTGILSSVSDAEETEVQAVPASPEDTPRPKGTTGILSFVPDSEPRMPIRGKTGILSLVEASEVTSTPTTPIAGAPTAMSWEDTLKQAMWNLFPSAWQSVEDTISIFDPGFQQIGGDVNTEGLFTILGWAPFHNMQRAGQLVGQGFIKLQEVMTGTDSEAKTELFDMLIEHYKARYGLGPDGIESVKQYIAQDPFGYISDLMMFASLGVGTAAKGAQAASVTAKLAKLKYVSRFEKISKGVQKANQVINKGFSISPDTNSVALRGIYKGVDLPGVKQMLDVTTDASGVKQINKGISQLEPGGLAADLVVGKTLEHGAQRIHSNFRERLMSAAKAQKIDLDAARKTADQAESITEFLDISADQIVDALRDGYDIAAGGRQALKAVRQYTQEFVGKKAEIYKPWLEQASQAKPVVTPLQDVLATVKSQAKRRQDGSLTSSEIKRIENTLQLLEELPENPSLSDLSKMQTEIQQKMGSGEFLSANHDRKWLAMVYHGITKSIDETVLTVAPHLKPAVQAMDEAYVVGVDKINTQWAKSIVQTAATFKGRIALEEELNRSEAEAIDRNRDGLMQMVFDPSTDADQIPLIYEAVGGFDSETGKSMRSYFVQRFLAESQKTGVDGKTAWLPAKLTGTTKDLDESSQGRLEAFLGKESADKVLLLSETLASLKASDSEATAALNPLLLLVGSGAGNGLIGSIGTELMPDNLHSQSAAITGELATANFVIPVVGQKAWDSWTNSEAGQNWLAEGFDAASAGQFLASIRHLNGTPTWHRIYRQANPQLREMMRQAQER